MIKEIESNLNFAEDSIFDVKIAIILAFYNGNEFIEEQIFSILNQSHKNFILYITDDCSSQNFSIENYNLSSSDKAKIKLSKRNKNLGYTFNFLYALNSLGNSYDYYAFSDQDDIWHKDKLKNAISALQLYSSKIPSLYGGRTELIGKNKNIKLGKSKLHKRKPSFKNAIIQNIIGGNTMVFNNAAKRTICKSIKQNKITSHDWWCYQIISGNGGNVIYDKRIFLKYRQHRKNLIGSNISLKSKLVRLCQIIKGEFRNKNDQNLNSLMNNSDLFTITNKNSLRNFIKARESFFLLDIYYFKKSGVTRQTFFENLILIIGIIIKKI